MDSTLKKIVSLILVISTITAGTAFAASKPLAAVTIPVNGTSIYYVDPDKAVGTTRTETVKVQSSVAKYASNGYLVGNRASQDQLLLGLESHQVNVYDVEVVDMTKLDAESLEMLASLKKGNISEKDFKVWLAQHTVSRITRLSTVKGHTGTTLNAETYSKKLHGEKAIIRLWVGEKKSQYWGIYERTLKDGSIIWTLVLQYTESKKSDPTPAPTKKPEPTKKPSPTPDPRLDDPILPPFDPTPAPTKKPADPTPDPKLDQVVLPPFDPAPTQAPTKAPQQNVPDPKLDQVVLPDFDD